MGFPGVASKTVIVSSTSRTALYVADTRPTQINARRVVFQVSVPDCMTYVCGLCIFAPGTLDQYGKLICFDVSSVTQNVTIIVPDQPEIVLGGCKPPSIITLGPEGQDPDCYDAHTLEEAVDIAISLSPLPTEIQVFPGVYEMNSLVITGLDSVCIVGQTCHCEDVVFTPIVPFGTMDDFVEFLDVSVSILNVTFDVAGDRTDGILEKIVHVTGDGKTCFMRNVCFKGSNVFAFGNFIYHLHVEDMTSLRLENCTFDQGGVAGDSISEMPTIGLLVSGVESVMVTGCEIGNPDTTLARWRRAACQFDVGYTTVSTKPDATVILESTTMKRAFGFGLRLRMRSRGSVDICDCDIFDIGSGPAISILSSNSLGDLFIPGGVTITNCKFRNIFTDDGYINVGSTVDGVQVSVSNCLFDHAFNDLAGHKQSMVTMQNETKQSANLLLVDSVYIGVGDLRMVDTTFVGVPSAVPSHVFLETGAGFGVDLVDTITSYNGNASPDSELVLADQGDIMWVGFDVPSMVGLLFNVVTGNPSLEASVLLTDEPAPPSSTLSRYVYDTAPSTSESPYVPGPVDDQFTYALTSLGSSAVGGTVNGVSALSWVAMRRLDDTGAGITINSLRGVGCSHSFRGGRNVIKLGCDGPFSVTSGPLLPVLLNVGSGFPELEDGFVGIEQRLRAWKFEPVVPGVQGIAASYNLPEHFAVSKKMFFVVVIAAVLDPLTGVQIRMQVTIPTDPFVDTVFSGSPLGSNNPNYYDSGYVLVSTTSAGRLNQMVFEIPENTFTLTTRPNTTFPVVFAMFERDSSLDGQDTGFYIVTSSLYYQTY